MRRNSSIAITAMIIGVLISISFSIALDPIAYSVVLNSNWQLTLTGLVDIPLNITLGDLAAMQQTTIFAQIYCVGPPGFFVQEGNWTGVKLKLLLENAGVDPATIKIAFYATDGFSTDLTLSSAMDDSILVAYEKNGLPIDETLRLVVPGRWGYKWIYHLNRIEAVNYNFLGKYESQGYSDTALTITSGGPGDVGSQLPNVPSLNRNIPSPNPTGSPSSSPTANFPTPSATHDSTTSNPKPGTGFKEEEIICLVIALIIVSLAVSLLFHFRKQKNINLHTDR